MAAKLFLGGIAPTTQKEDLEQHFSSYGTVIDAVVMFKDGRHRGFGFVTFADRESMDAVLAEAQVIHERTIDVKPAVPSDEAPPPRNVNGAGGFMAGGRAFLGNGGGGGGYGGSYASGYTANSRPSLGSGGFGACGGRPGGCSYAPGPNFPALPPKGPAKGPAKGAAKGATKGVVKGKGGGGHVGATDKVFIGGLAPITTDDSLNTYFSRYGTLVDVVVMKDNVTQKSRGFGFVRYDSTEPVEQVMADYHSHELDGKWIEVKKAVPQEQMAAPPRGPLGKGGSPGKGSYPPMQSAYGVPDFYGAPTGYHPPAYAPCGGGAYVGAGKGGGARARPY